MLNIPDAVKALYQTDNTRKNFRVRFPDGERADICNSEIVQESVRFTESLCSRSVFRFGLCEASSLEFETVGVGNYYGSMIRCFLEIDTSSLTAAQLAEIAAGNWDGELVPEAESDIGYGFFRIPLGLFRVESCPRNHEALAHRRFTAYTVDFGHRSSTQPGLPKTAPFARLTADPGCWLAQVTGEGLTTLENAAAGERSTGMLYDAAGNPAQLRFFADNGTTRRYPLGLPRPNDMAAFYHIEGLAFDRDAYSAVGQEIAEALTAAYGTSYCYDSEGNQIYPDMLSALLDVYPYLFAPALIAVPLWWSGSAWSIFSNPVWSYPLENGKRYPLLRHQGFWGDPWGDIVPMGRPTGYALDKIEYSAMYFSGDAVRKITLYSVSGARALWTYSLEGQFPTVTPPTAVESSRLTTPSGYEVVIDNTGEGTPSSQNRGTNVILPRWSYVGAADQSALVSGWLELQAAFGKVERDGRLSVKRLDADSPVGILPVNIREAWWDEIDVEPIGTVRFNFRGDEEEQTVEYQFGRGGSVYDMTDNAALKCIDFAAADEVIALLDAHFIPRLGAVTFTPLELRARGLPWIEDGDALAVTAGDGTTVYSYALRRELSGVQILADDITSEGGNLREDGR